MLGSDWVGLAHELDISDSDINLIKSQYPDNVSQQAIVMLRLWMQTSGTNKSITGNALEKGLRKINREDIVTQCIFNVELVTDDIERAMAKAHLDQSGFDAFRDELGPSRDATFIRDVSLDVSYDEQDLMKEAESAEEEEENHKSYPVLGGLTAVQEETLVAKSRSQVEPNKPESSQVVVDHLQPSLDGPTTITTNIIKTTISTSNVPDGFTQTSVESSQMSSERGTAEVTSVGDTEQGEQHTTMLMGQGTHESTSQSQQVVEQPTALSKDQDNNVFKSKLSEAELAVLDSNILAQKSDVDELAFTNLQRDSMSQEIKTTQEELVSLTNEKNIGAQFIMSQESMAIKSPVHKSLENDDVIAKISYSEDVQEEDNCSHLILSSNESDLLSQIVKTQDVQEIISPVQLPQQNVQCTSPSVQSVCSAELKADAGGGGGGGNSEKEFNIQNRENIDKKLDKHNITDVNKRVADVVSSMASTLESITAAAEGFEGGHGSSDEGEEQLMLMRDSPRWEDEEIQADEHEEPRAIKAEIKLLVKTTELGKESIEIRSIREFVEADDSLTCGSGGTMPSSYSDHRVSSSSTGQVTPSGERVYTLQRESIAGQFPSPRFVRLQPSTGSAEGSTHDDFDLMAQVRDVVESGASGAGVHQPRGSSRGPK